LLQSGKLIAAAVELYPGHEIGVTMSVAETDRSVYICGDCHGAEENNHRAVLGSEILVSPAVITEGGKTVWLAGHVGFVDDPDMHRYIESRQAAGKLLLAIDA
jgi:pyruvate/2-oxoglutarate dehydrogenase complex dihydrolipoamide dehydrogenase (E3) component